MRRVGADIHSAGGGATVEAPPWRPGHAGHTPQPLVAALIADRTRNVLTSSLALVMPVEYAMHNFRRPQRFEAPGQVATLLAIEDFRRRRGLPHAEPEPISFRAAITGPVVRR